MKSILFSFGSVFCLTLFLTFTSTAVASSALALSPTHTLLTTTFDENFLNSDVIVPVLASTTSSHNPLSLSYQLDGIDEVDIVSTKAVVLSSLSIMNGGYQALAGSKNTYMLVVLIEHTANARPTSLSLTSLPFLITTNGAIDGQSVKTY